MLFLGIAGLITVGLAAAFTGVVRLVLKLIRSTL